jgi:hypothetical protein
MKSVVFTVTEIEKVGYNNEILKCEYLTEDTYRPKWAAHQIAPSEM